MSLDRQFQLDNEHIITSIKCKSIDRWIRRVSYALLLIGLRGVLMDGSLFFIGLSQRSIYTIISPKSAIIIILSVITFMLSHTNSALILTNRRLVLKTKTRSLDFPNDFIEGFTAGRRRQIMPLRILIGILFLLADSLLATFFLVDIILHIVITPYTVGAIAGFIIVLLIGILIIKMGIQKEIYLTIQMRSGEEWSLDDISIYEENKFVDILRNIRKRGNVSFEMEFTPTSILLPEDEKVIEQPVVSRKIARQYGLGLAFLSVILMSFVTYFYPEIQRLPENPSIQWLVIISYFIVFIFIVLFASGGRTIKDMIYITNRSVIISNEIEKDKQSIINPFEVSLREINNNSIIGIKWGTDWDRIKLVFAILVFTVVNFILIAPPARILPWQFPANLVLIPVLYLIGAALPLWRITLITRGKRKVSFLVGEEEDAEKFVASLRQFNIARIKGIGSRD